MAELLGAQRGDSGCAGLVSEANRGKCPPMRMVPCEEMDRRRRMWVLCASPLFDFFIDMEPDEDDFRAVGRTAREVGYTSDDVKRIYWREVVPAIMGTWGRMDPANPEWLERRIRQQPRIGYRLSWILRPWWGSTAWQYWRRIRKEL